MDPELKAKWVAALRSGEFKQGTTLLHSTVYDTYCCLGVLCEISGTKKEALTTSDRYIFGDSGDYTGVTTVIPADAFGIPYSIATDLMAMNDADDKSFDEIADFIEAYL